MTQIATVHTQLGFREKLVDKIAKKLLEDSDYRHLQFEWNEPSVEPSKQYHGGTYTGTPSVTILDNARK